MRESKRNVEGATELQNSIDLKQVLLFNLRKGVQPFDPVNLIQVKEGIERGVICIGWSFNPLRQVEVTAVDDVHNIFTVTSLTEIEPGLKKDSIITVDGKYYSVMEVNELTAFEYNITVYEEVDPYILPVSLNYGAEIIQELQVELPASGKVILDQETLQFSLYNSDTQSYEEINYVINTHLETISIWFAKVTSYSYVLIAQGKIKDIEG
jgi:hypothetical protein